MNNLIDTRNTLRASMKEELLEEYEEVHLAEKIVEIKKAIIARPFQDIFFFSLNKNVSEAMHQTIISETVGTIIYLWVVTFLVTVFTVYKLFPYSFNLWTWMIVTATLALTYMMIRECITLYKEHLMKKYSIVSNEIKDIIEKEIGYYCSINESDMSLAVHTNRLK